MVSRERCWMVLDALVNSWVVAVSGLALPLILWTAGDTKDWDLYETCFTPDAFIDYESAGGINSSGSSVVMR